MKCLKKYSWVKVPRGEIPFHGKGILIYYMRLASRAAFRKGTARYCGYTNAVEVGSWVGGMVGLKSILEVKKRRDALEIMDELQMLGYITYTLEPDTKILTYKITDWVIKCSGKACSEGENIYTTPKYGFLCMPRIITERLVEKGHKFGEADAWLDLWCHTVYRDKGNAFSFLAPAIQYGKFGSVLTLETLGKRWKWEKTKVWRFFQFYCAYFPLHRLPGSFGCVIYNRCYPTQDECDDPSDEEVMRILELIRIKARNTHTEGTDNERINRFVAWKSRKVIQALEDEYTKEEIQEKNKESSDFRDVLNWWDITEVDGHCSLNTKLRFVLASAGMDRTCELLKPILLHCADPRAIGVLDSQSVLRMINLLTGMLHIPVTKEQLMELNQELNKIPIV